MRRLWWLGMLLCACTGTSGGSDASSDTYVGCGGDNRINYPQDVPTDKPAGLQLHFLSAEPAVPLAGENTWTFEIRDANGSPVDANTVTAISVATFMPDHGHPGSVVPTVTGANGKWRMDHLYLSMAGIWRVTLTLTMADGAASQTAVVFVCVAG